MHPGKIFLMIFVATASVIPCLAQGTLDDGLVAHYRFEGNADDRLGQHHGELQGEPRFVPSPWGSGIYFDGDGAHVSVTDSPDFSPGIDDFSVSAWFRFPADFTPQHPGQYKNQLLIIQDEAESFQWVQLSGWGVSLDDLQNSIEFGMKSGSNASQTLAQLDRSPYWDDRWHHVAGVRRDIHTFELYIDGVLEAVNTNPILFAPETFSSKPMLIGYDPGYGGWPMLGAIDELRIYRRALSREEIIQLAAPACAGDELESGNLADWTLDGVGHANQFASEIVDDAGNLLLELTSDGATAYYGRDNAGFFYQALTGDFRVETTVDSTTMVTGQSWCKAGLMVRASLDDYDIRLLTMVAPVQERIQFAARESYGGPGNIKLGVEVPDAPQVVRFAVERAGQTLSVQYSLDEGVTWITPSGGSGGSLEIADLPEALLVGPAVVSNDISVTSTARFDDFLLCAAP